MSDQSPDAWPQSAHDTPEPDENTPASYPAAVEDQTAGLPAEIDAGTTRALSRLLTATPFIDLHHKAGGDSAWRRRLCFTLDLLFRLAVYVLLLGIIALVAWKVLAPVPPLPSGLVR